MSKIYNIVFYKTKNNGKEERQACIFYNDGTVKNVSYKEGISACEDVVKDLNINSKDAFKEMINKNIVHVMSGSEFEKRFNEFTYKNVKEELTNNVINLPSINNSISDEDMDEENIVSNDLVDDNTLNNSNIPPVPVFKRNRDYRVKRYVDYEDDNKLENDDKMSASVADDNNIEVEFNDNNGNKKKSKIRNWAPVKKIIAFGTAAAILCGGVAYTLKNKNNFFGKMTKSFVPAQAEEFDESVQENPFADFTVAASNDNYNGYSFEQLLSVTTNNYQRDAMTKLFNVIQLFNGSFADAHVEEGKDVRAALSFDEVVALQNAYNDYSVDQIKAYFNGAEIRSMDLENSYKTATLQLMGAHVIETSENPVDMSGLIDSEEGRIFYAKYHRLFIEAKEATGEDKLAKINAFYQAVREDFPITEDVRTEGISHSDSYSSIVPYKLAVTPMIAAAEIIFQNYEHDYTLDDAQIDFLNDLGLCNYAKGSFDRVEQITLNAKVSYGEDDTNPLYEQYRNSIIKYLTDRGEYVIDDEHRELSLLDAFQNTVNWHFNEDGEWVFEGGVYYTTETHTQVETHTVTETETTVVEERVEKPIPDDVREEIDREIEEENERAREEAEREAERERQRLQEEADREAERIREQIREEEEDLQQDIEDANERINENNQDDDPSNDTPVNEEDFGDHNVDFFDDYSDDHGNLDDSVEEITTDDTDVRTHDDLPDPNETGRSFDETQVVESNAASFAASYDEPVANRAANDTQVEVVVEENSVEEKSSDISAPEVREEEPREERRESPVVEIQPEEPKEVHEESGKSEVHYEEPKEVHQEETKTQEVHYEEPKEVHQEEHHEESKKSSQSYEEAVDAYVESVANESYEEESYGYSY